jgi:hypothetical protein
MNQDRRQSKRHACTIPATVETLDGALLCTGYVVELSEWGMRFRLQAWMAEDSATSADVLSSESLMLTMWCDGRVMGINAAVAACWSNGDELGFRIVACMPHVRDCIRRVIAGL